MLPENLMQSAGLTDQALFAGQGDYFTIWNPAKYDAQTKADQQFTEQDLAEFSAGWNDVLRGKQ